MALPVCFWIPANSFYTMNEVTCTNNQIPIAIGNAYKFYHAVVAGKNVTQFAELTRSCGPEMPTTNPGTDPGIF